MKFYIKSAKYYLTDNEGNKLIKEYPCLKKYRIYR